MNTTYFRNLVAGCMFKTGDHQEVPAKYYIGLSTTDPTEQGACTEPVEMNYKRVPFENITTPDDGYIKNQEAITFEESTGSWGVITHYLLFDAESQGNLLLYGRLKDPKTVDSETIVTFRPEEFKIRVVNAEIE